MKKGISDRVFPSNWSVEKSLRISNKVGFNGIEPYIQEKGGMLNLNTLSHEAAALAYQCQKKELEIPSLSTMLHNQYPLNSGMSTLN